MKLLRFHQLATEKGIGYSRVHVARLEAAGKFPARVHLGANSVGWVEAEIDAWLEARVAARNAPHDGVPQRPAGANAVPAAA